jgi:hypothetical protein
VPTDDELSEAAELDSDAYKNDKLNPLTDDRLPDGIDGSQIPTQKKVDEFYIKAYQEALAKNEDRVEQYRQAFAEIIADEAFADLKQLIDGTDSLEDDIVGDHIVPDIEDFMKESRGDHQFESLPAAPLGDSGDVVIDGLYRDGSRDQITAILSGITQAVEEMGSTKSRIGLGGSGEKNPYYAMTLNEVCLSFAAAR